ncbi:hypothetical protein GUJ93_ZPchr0007g5230 [Zizania palustris]|uniref:RING-CH-type domain-containing protein n=1 Tax=Zizania palustris TaxID=103762 RepID=A0A8J5TCM2_ZIZPA|nr:hypothetical protein GUJ93_ZPchr0007g5230 [Zizania palustris]
MVNNGEQTVIAAAAEPGVEPAGRDDLGGDDGERGAAAESSDEKKGSQRFSDAEDQPWRPRSRRDSAALEDLISTCASARSGAGVSAGDVDEAGAAGHGRGRKSCVSECSLDDADLEAGLAEITKATSPDTVEKNCRICHLGLDSAAAESGSGMSLGCSCKNDLSCAHKQCAETWFKIRGNRICEICGSTACNVVGTGDAEFIEHWNGSSNAAAAAASEEPRRRFWQGHRFLNFLLACMVFAFVISWLFHFNVPG